MMCKQTEKIYNHTQRLLKVIAPVVLIGMVSANAFASSSDWLSVDLNTRKNVSFDQDPGSFVLRDVARDFFTDDVNLSVTVTQSVRGMMDPNLNDDSARLVEGMFLTDAILASDWFSSLPTHKNLLSQVEKPYFECELNAVESTISCDDASQSTVRTGTSDAVPREMVYGEALVSQIIRHDVQQDLAPAGAATVSTTPAQEKNIVLVPKAEGLLSVEGGEIVFKSDGVSRLVELAKEVSIADWSIFVREPSVVAWDGVARTLTSKKAGETEIFVVSPGRISIIPLSVSGRPQKIDNAVLKNSISAVQVSTGLATLDGLDRAAAAGPLAASFAQNQQQNTTAEFAIDRGVTELGSQSLTASGHIVRAKAKVSFDSIRLKLIDERSTVQGQTFPVSGVRVKVAGTDFSELTDARGEVDIREIPTGSRILLEITDDRGYLMPQVTEINADRDGVARTITQPVRTRRFSSLDLIARSGAVVQDMRKSSFCGTVHHGPNSQSDVSVALDVYANGPYYFNNLGLVDLRRSGTGSNGLFCFFNVEPGPVTVSLRRGNDKHQLATLIGLIAGRHSEEAIDLSEAKHLTTTITAIPSANEQLGSDVLRANARDIIEQADLFAVGSGQLMVSVDQGLFSTPTRVLPMKGRVWTVSSTQDFETAVQPLAARSPAARQVSTMIPNGFISDMAVFANTTHDLSLGSVLVEHGHLSGHGNESVKFRLVDHSGRDVGDGWYFSDNPVTKALFFNVPPGVYGLIVETADGHWISADTTVVYSESVSFVKTGSPLERLARSVQRALAH